MMIFVRVLLGDANCPMWMRAPRRCFARMSEPAAVAWVRREIIIVVISVQDPQSRRGSMGSFIQGQVTPPPPVSSLRPADVRHLSASRLVLVTWPDRGRRTWPRRSMAGRRAPLSGSWGENKARAAGPSRRAKRQCEA